MLPYSQRYLWGEVSVHDGARVQVAQAVADVGRELHASRPRQQRRLVGKKLLQVTSVDELKQAGVGHGRELRNWRNRQTPVTDGNWGNWGIEGTDVKGHESPTDGNWGTVLKEQTSRNISPQLELRNCCEINQGTDMKRRKSWIRTEELKEQKLRDRIP